MAFTHVKTVTVSPVDDPYNWTVIDDATNSTASWITVTAQTDANGNDTDTWDFLVADNTGSARSATATVNHSNGVTTDSFTIDQAGVAQTTQAPEFTCSDANVNINNGSVGATVTATLALGTVASISPSTYVLGNQSYTVNVTVPGGYSNSGSNLACQTSATGTTTLAQLSAFDCSDANVNINNGSVGATVTATVSAGTVASISPSTYSLGANNYTVNVTVPGGYSNSGSNLVCQTSATGTTTLAPAPIGLEPSPETPAPSPTPAPIPSPSPSPGCHVAGTMIEMADGTFKAIENIVVGDQVITAKISGLSIIENAWLSWSTATEYFSMEEVTGHVSALHVNSMNGWINVNSGLIKVTEEHPLLSDQSGVVAYREIRDLGVGDKIYVKSGAESYAWVDITSYELEYSDAEKSLVDVYSIDVENEDSYFANGVLAHNIQTGGGPSTPAPIGKNFYN